MTSHSAHWAERPTLLRAFALKEPDAPGHAATPMQQKFFWVGTHHQRCSLGVAVQLLLCCGARCSWPRVFLRPGRSRACQLGKW